jgi:hypothetical protein
MRMKLGELINLMSSKNGDELFEKVGNLLVQFDISVYNNDGSVKNVYTLCCDAAEALNKEK